MLVFVLIFVLFYMFRLPSFCPASEEKKLYLNLFMIFVIFFLIYRIFIYLLNLFCFPCVFFFCFLKNLLGRLFNSFVFIFPISSKIV